MRPVGKRPVQMSNFFRSAMHRENYNKLADRRCDSGKNVDESFLRNFFNNLFSCLMVQQLGTMISMSEKYFPDLMRHFFAGISPVGQSVHISAFVRANAFIITEEDIANVLEVELGGEDVIDSGASTSHEGFSRLGAMNLVTNRVYGTASRIKSSDMTLECRILHWIIVHIIYPKSGSYSEVGSFELLLMWMILTRRKIDIPKLILRKMRTGGKEAAPLFYGMLLTKIFRLHGVDLEGHASNDILSSDTLNEKTLRRMGYIEVGGEWRPKKRSREKSPIIVEEEEEGEGEAGPSGSTPTLDNIMRGIERLEARQDGFEEHLKSMDKKLDQILYHYTD